MSKGIYDLLVDIAARCNIRNEKVLKRSKELITILNSKQNLSCSDTCKVVACLELASSFSSSPLSREEAVKYSGCKKKNYTNIYNNISKLLNLEKIYSVSEICLLVGVYDIQESAAKLLQKYQTICQKHETDFEHPMYACAAVLAFCRANKVKINLTKIIEISRVKKLELEELAKKFQPLLEVKKKEAKTEQKKDNSLNLIKASEEKDDEISPKKKKAITGVMTDEEYKEWKRRMLED